MKYLEIAEGLSVRINEIEAIGSGKKELTSKVYTHHNVYDSSYPYKVLLELLEKNIGDDIEQEQLNILKQVGTFSG